MTYRLDISGIKTTFKFKNDGKLKLQHSTGNSDNKFPLLPYRTNATDADISNYISNFTSIVGVFSRLISNQNIDAEVNLKSLPENIADKVIIESYEDKAFFIRFIRNAFLLDGELIVFHPKILNCQPISNKEHTKIALFLYGIFYEYSVDDYISNLYNRTANNILTKLILEFIPVCNNKMLTETIKYFNYVPYVKEVFLEDLKFLTSKIDLYLSSLDKLIRYYYFYYVSQLTLKLDKMFKADLSKPERLFFNLSDEKISSYRESSKQNWNELSSKSDRLFYHAIFLEILNHNYDTGKFTYPDLKNIAETLTDDEKLLFSEDIEEFINDYKNQTAGSGLSWSAFKFDYYGDNICLEMMEHLYKAIEFLFKNGGRNGADIKYCKNFKRYCEKYFLKSHGRSGRTLTIWQDMLVFITQLCIKDNEKLSIKNLFKEYERRGLFFDYESKKLIIQTFEKLALLEKKSDSGDAQYVKAIL